MKKIIVMLALLMIPLATATSNIGIGLDTTEDLNAQIDLEADGDMQVWINGDELANKEYVTNLGLGGGVRNRMTEIITDAVGRIQDGTIFSPKIHTQTAIIGQALLKTFITRSESDLDWLYHRFRARLVEDIASGKIDQMVLEAQNRSEL